jgi:hypothetical protein
MFIRIVYLFIYLLILQIINIFNTSINTENFESSKDFDGLDGIIYINLDNRPDRKNSITSEINKIFGNSQIPIERISATYIPKNGHKGCAHSHYMAINKARELKWKTVLIFEDDFHFTSETSKTQLDNLFKTIKQLPEWKVILLTGVGGKSEKTQHNGINKITSGYLTTSAYIVNLNYYNHLIYLFYKSYLSMSSDKTSIKNYEPNAIDQLWAKVQTQEDGWYIINPIIGEQNNQLISTIQSQTNYSGE